MAIWQHHFSLWGFNISITLGTFYTPPHTFFFNRTKFHLGTCKHRVIASWSAAFFGTLQKSSAFCWCSIHPEGRLWACLPLGVSLLLQTDTTQGALSRNHRHEPLKEAEQWRAQEQDLENSLLAALIHPRCFASIDRVAQWQPHADHSGQCRQGFFLFFFF